MALQNLKEAEFRSILETYLTPSGSIKTPERLFGRQRFLTQVERALASQGRQVLIYGDRGVGKTSLALTAAYLITHVETTPIWVTCSEKTEFEDVIQAIGRRSISSAENFELHGNAGGAGIQAFGMGANFARKQPPKIVFERPNNLNECLEIVRYVSDHSSGKRVVVIDEMERISSKDEREKFAEFIKNVPEVGDNLKFIFCGIGSTVNELIGAHPSAGRVLETIQLPRLNHDDLWRIIETVGQKLGVTVDREMLIRIGQLSDGFPHYVHLVGESMFWSINDDTEVVTQVQKRHFADGIKGAIERAEALLRQQYDIATLKSKLREDYEETLWALADTTSDSRQVKEIFEWSYKRIVRLKTGKAVLSREMFNQRLLALKKPSHGSVVTNFGSGWFGFRENILRGYVRLKAEEEGIELGRDIR
jgi:uncharacterized protein